jgi:hypothetical protein
VLSDNLHKIPWLIRSNRGETSLDFRFLILDNLENEFYMMFLKEFGFLLDYVETGFIKENDRRIIDRFTFRQQCIGAREAQTACSVLGVELTSPVIMSSMTMPIPAIADDALFQLARGLKAAGSLMWTGTPIPKNLKEIARTGVPVRCRQTSIP